MAKRSKSSGKARAEDGVFAGAAPRLPGVSKGWSAALMLLATALMLPLLFPPFYCFFLAPFALVPFCVCIVRRPMRKLYLLAYYLLGVAFFLPNLFWLAPVTGPGFIALALFTAVYFPLFALGVHRLVFHFRLPATIAVPLVWTAVEYLRGNFPLGGFPWFLLGNCLTPATVLIQGADIFGVWGLSFFIALLNGFIVDVLRLPLWDVAKNGAKGGRRFSPVIGSLIAAVAILVAGVVGYGVFRLSQKTTRPGPRVAVIQENIPQSLKDAGTSDQDIFFRHLKLSKQAAAVLPKPDLIAWPETMVPGFGNDEFLMAPDRTFSTFEVPNYFIDRRDHSRFYFDTLGDLCDQTDVPLLLGVGSMVPKRNYNDSIKQNRTVLLSPHVARQVDYYSKVHLVPFGEYIPFRGVPVLGGLMLKLSPSEGFDFSNVPGDRWERFALPATVYGTSGLASYPPPAHPNAAFTFGTPICFEDTMPEPARRMSAPQYAGAGGGGGGRKADFLVNVSNDGWFHWVELDQHLQASQIRAVENRVSIARSVNTGNSGFIDSNGRIIKLVTGSDGSSIGAVGFEVVEIPVDSRVTIFSRIGDLFPIICGVVSVLLAAWTLVRPRRA